MSVLKIIYWGALVIEVAIRAPFRKTWKTAPKTFQRISRIEKFLLGLLSVGGVILPLVYSVTNWLDFANYHLPPWLSWSGVVLLTGAVLIFARTHRDLKTNWSPFLEIFAGHSLVTNGIYRYIRHPMYASQWLWTLAQILLLQNWIAGPITLIIFTPFYCLRVKPEEELMQDQFSDQYREYMQKTGRIFPKIHLQ
jgi:protein-S-isoprenylcysteine O-methyltransferase Ste14